MYTTSSTTTGNVIKAALSVYNELGYGFLESFYAKCFKYELEGLGLSAKLEQKVTVGYKDAVFAEY